MRVTFFVCIVLLFHEVVSLQLTQEHYEIANTVLNSVPLVDGHNDLADNLRKLVQNKLNAVDLMRNLSGDSVWGRDQCARCFTDFARLRQGKVGAQFWSARVLCNTHHKDAAQKTMEQIDVIKRFTNKYSNILKFVTTAEEITEVFSSGKIGSLIGVEGGHSIDNRLAILRLYYELGARYMTLAHFCNTPWVDAFIADQPDSNEDRNNGLTDFGKIVVREMNRLGMMVDLSHTSKKTQIDALAISTAPIIFSHSNAFSLCGHHRNVHDDVLQMLKRNKGIIMVNFYNPYVTCSKEGTLEDVVRHINHIRNITGVDHIGIGSDYDGIDHVPEGLEDVSSFPTLFARLAADPDEPWNEQDLRKLAGLNFIRVFKEVEKVRDAMVTEGVEPYDDLIPRSDLGNHTTCITPYP